MTDPRIRENRVKAARKATWLIGDDPTPVYSPIDRADGLGTIIVIPKPVPARPQIDFDPVLPDLSQDWREIRRNTWVVVLGVVMFGLVAAGVWMVARWMA